jgi:hypothetical protein
MQTDDSVSNVIAANLTKSLQACKTRVILTEEQVINIYLIKLANGAPSLHESKNNRAPQLAEKYGVSEKTVRDIWMGRTWYSTSVPTYTFW